MVLGPGSPYESGSRFPHLGSRFRTEAAARPYILTAIAGHIIKYLAADCCSAWDFVNCLMCASRSLKICSGWAGQAAADCCCESLGGFCSSVDGDGLAKWRSSLSLNLNPPRARDLAMVEDIISSSTGVPNVENDLILRIPCGAAGHARSAGLVETSGGSSMLQCMSVCEKEEQRLERLLEILDRLVDTCALGSPQTDNDSVAEATASRSSGVFLQEVYDIFCEDEKVHVLHSFYERNLDDPLNIAWFRLPDNTPSCFAMPTDSLFLDPDGTFQRRETTRPRCDVLYSLQLLAAEMTLGLLFLHERGIVHSDIRPANIMVTPSGHIQIGNFGSAHVLPRLLPSLVDLPEIGSDTTRTDLSFGSSVISLIALDSNFGGRAQVDDDCGNPVFGSMVLGPDDEMQTTRYSAPELQERDEQGRLIFNERVDWWSLGVVLYELGYGDSDSGSHELRQQRQIEDFQDFLLQLIKGSSERLNGIRVQKHRFLDFEHSIWKDILGLLHPPCPVVDSVIFQYDSEQENQTSFSGGIPTTQDFLLVSGVTESLSVVVPLALEVPLSDDECCSEDSDSGIQPFPSSASLYQDIRARYLQDEAATTASPP
ncbi:hypothetical protein NP233_g12903 [Leucocoprinus birnbaumii]|uniref:non-specific serine/threonine protein kinase n=1 Tax=Leucocoprinus birnbaumii TaxID=56174 RepID=A0AAD5VDM7_9AGAR|nr:hypothetical protein NP233_g12903 [Leucocoprinus birnbaumii]